MASQYFRTFNTTDREINQLQNNVRDAISAILKNPMVDGQLLTKLVLASGSNTVEHKLGRPILGYIVVSTSNAVTFNDNVATSRPEDKNNSFTLVASGGTTVSLYVF